VVAVAFAVTRPEPRVVAQPVKPAAKPYNGLIGGVELQSARCVQWNNGTAAERSKVVGALAYAVGGATPYGRGTTLTTDQAYTLLDSTCANPIAANWLLYHLYIRAAGFRSYGPQT
jgi:hypothetical protein